MDDEGVPCQDTAVIEEGVLQGFIWNDYWAKRMGCSSTGNANYDEKSNEMLIQPTTMVGSPGVYTREELFDVKDGYYIQDVQGAQGPTLKQVISLYCAVLHTESEKGNYQAAALG
jgi:PmbA protein